MRYASIEEVVALSKRFAVKYGAVGIAGIEENVTRDGITVTLTDKTKFTVTFNGMLLKSVYDINGNGIVDNSEALSGHPGSFYTISSNIAYDNTISGLIAHNVEAAIDELMDEIINYVGRAHVVSFDATLSNNTVNANLVGTLSNFTFTNNTEYWIDIVLPIITLTGDLPNNYSIQLKDKNKNTITINCIYQKDNTITCTVGELCEIQTYDPRIGYKWYFKGMYKEYVDNGSTIRLIYTDTVTRGTSVSMTGNAIYTGVVNASLNSGMTVTCTEDYTLSGRSFQRGHVYLVRSKLVGDVISLDTVDISLRGLPQTDAKIIGSQKTPYTISAGGTYIFLGDVSSLSISTNDHVYINIIGTLGAVTLPNTSKTVHMNATEYSGSPIRTATTGPYADGSRVGVYNIRTIALD